MTAAHGTAVVTEVTMPRLSDSMTEGTIVAWLVTDRTSVATGQEIAEIETDKATMAFEAEAAGVIRLLAGAGELVDVGTPIARIFGGPAAATRAAVDLEAVASAPLRPGPEPPPPPPARISVSPLARRLAAGLGVDLTGLVGSGPRGRIIRSDVLATAAPRSPSPGADRTPVQEPSGAGAGGARIVEPTRVQQLIARRMVQAKVQAPEFVLEAEIDMTEARRVRGALKAALTPAPPPSLNDLIVRACGVALSEHPRVNGAWIDERFVFHDRVNVGFAVGSDEELLVPVIADADRRSLGQIAAETRGLVAAARDGRLTPAQLEGATFSISNLGMFGVDRFTAVLNPPQAAILAVGAIRERLLARSGAAVARFTMHVALTCDHRIVYGVHGARFLSRVRELLECPELLAL